MPCVVTEEEDRAMTEMARKAKGEATLHEVEAMLCGIATALETHGNNALARVLSNVNWKEVGVERQLFENWWKNHKAKDAARKATEQQKAADEQLRQSALAKLTPEERKALKIP